MKGGIPGNLGHSHILFMTELVHQQNIYRIAGIFSEIQRVFQLHTWKIMGKVT